MPNTPAPQTLFIDTAAKLLDLCASLEGRPWIALDTEFLREKTYFPKFCLLQVATDDVVACIDPLALDSLEPLLHIIFDSNITKVLHSGRQDLEIFYRLSGRLPSPVFDTQIAAPLLGLGEQLSYANLVNEMLGVSLNKAHSRTDWSRRPLSAEQLRYAADDVIYLGRAYLKMLPKLTSMQRMTWLEKDFGELVNPDLYDPPPEQAWQRINGVHQLKAQQLSILQSLAAWRELTAREQDLPRGWLLKDEVLFDLARQQPSQTEELKIVRGIDERTVKRHGPALCQLILEAKQRQPQTVELKPRPARKSPDTEAQLDMLMAVVRVRAAEHSLNPAILASRKDLENFIDGEIDARLTSGWRRNLVGEDLAAMVRGELGLSIEDGKLRIHQLS